MCASNKFYQIETHLNNLYNRQYENVKSDIILNALTIEELYEEQIEELNQFHMDEVVLVRKNDEYFCGLRANHFVVEIGWSENKEDHSVVYLITCNHKGLRAMTMIEMVL